MNFDLRIAESLPSQRSAGMDDPRTTFHLTRDGRRYGALSLCGVPTMPTGLPIEDWTLRTLSHSNKYCAACESRKAEA